MRRFHTILFALALQMAALSGCDRGMGPDTAATAGDFRLSVEDAAQILAPVSALPNEAEVVETTLEFWTDYTLLALAVNRPGAVEALDMGPLLDLEKSRQLVLKLRDEVIQVDTTLGDAELATLFEEERPGEEIRARHILLSVPPGATQAQVDSIRATAEDLRDRALAGEDFSALARDHSEDPGSAVQGGDLGFFERGLMVPPFEEAAFALQPGEISDVVRSDFGFHVIKLEERRRPTLEDLGPDYRSQIQQQRIMQAESIYLAGIEEPANVQIADGAIAVVREITDDPEEDLSRREASALLTTFAGGGLTAGQYRDFLFSQPPEVWQQILSVGDDRLEVMLREMSRDRILLSEAEGMGIRLTPEEETDLSDQVHEQYLLIADFLGLDSLQVAEGETLDGVVEREVGGLMTRLVNNEQDIVPLGPLARPLRQRYGAREADDAAQRIMARIDELRSSGVPGQSPGAPIPTVPQPPVETSSDSSGPGP